MNSAVDDDDDLTIKKSIEGFDSEGSYEPPSSTFKEPFDFTGYAHSDESASASASGNNRNETNGIKIASSTGRSAAGAVALTDGNVNMKSSKDVSVPKEIIFPASPETDTRAKPAHAPLHGYTSNSTSHGIQQQRQQQSRESSKTKRIDSSIEILDDTDEDDMNITNSNAQNSTSTPARAASTHRESVGSKGIEQQRHHRQQRQRSQTATTKRIDPDIEILSDDDIPNRNAITSRNRLKNNTSTPTRAIESVNVAAQKESQVQDSDSTVDLVGSEPDNNSAPRRTTGTHPPSSRSNATSSGTNSKKRRRRNFSAGTMQSNDDIINLCESDEMTMTATAVSALDQRRKRRRMLNNGRNSNANRSANGSGSASPSDEVIIID